MFDIFLLKNLEEKIEEQEPAKSESSDEEEEESVANELSSVNKMILFIHIILRRPHVEDLEEAAAFDDADTDDIRIVFVDKKIFSLPKILELRNCKKRSFPFKFQAKMRLLKKNL